MPTDSPKNIAELEPPIRSLEEVISEARKKRRIKDGLVLCENCDNPASASLSQALSWTGCAPCVWGEADSFDDKDLIYADR